MTKEDRELLLKDLSARLTYGVKCNAILKQIDGSLKSIFGTFKGYNGWATVGNNLVDIETIKPYLRPMSSMTDRESKEFALLQTDFYVDGFLYPIAAINMINWLNSHYFDYCGLIERGLALEAPENMYNIK